MQQHIDFSTFSARFTWAIDQHPGTQMALAEAMGASPAVVTQWKTGPTKNYDAVMAVKAARFLNVDSEWLILGVGTPERISKTSSQVAEIISGLPRDPRQQTLDFISYQLTKAEPLLIGEKAAHYHKMIDAIIDDMKTRGQ